MNLLLLTECALKSLVIGAVGCALLGIAEKSPAASHGRTRECLALGALASLVRESEWTKALTQAHSALGWSGKVALRETRNFGPAAVGLFHRTILIPSSCEHWSPATKRMVLAHELAHFQRYDLAIQAVARLAMAVQWFNPFAHMILGKIEEEREFACDAAVRHTTGNLSDYAACLLELAGNSPVPRAPVPALAIWPQRRGSLECRVHRLLTPVRDISVRNRIACTLLILAGAATIAACCVLTPVPHRQPVAFWSSAEIAKRLSADPFPESSSLVE